MFVAPTGPDLYAAAAQVWMALEQAVEHQQGQKSMRGAMDKQSDP